MTSNPKGACLCGHPESHHVAPSLGSIVGGWHGCTSCFNATPPRACELFTARSAPPPAASVEGTTPPSLRELAEASIAAFRAELARKNLPTISPSMWYAADGWSDDDGIGPEDAEFIAAATPAAILALLDELESTRSALAAKQIEWDQQARKLHDFADDLRDEAVRDCKADLASLRSALREAQLQTAKCHAFQHRGEGTDCICTVCEDFRAAAGSTTP